MFLQRRALKNINKNIVIIDTFDDLKHYFNWDSEPIIDDPIHYLVEYDLDKNNRRLLDAQVIGTIIRNTHPQKVLEIGTAEGHGTALIAENWPDAHIFTVNIPPEEICSGEGGVFTTCALEKERIGSYYRGKNIKNISQIYANTAKWTPDIDLIDVAFIDGCHDTEFVYNDSIKIIGLMKKSGVILWHDFNIDLLHKYDWIYSVSLGIELLYKNKKIKGPVYHLKNSLICFHFLE